MINYVSPTIPGLTNDALREHGLYQLMRAAGIQLQSAKQTIGARKATAEEARQLGEPRAVGAADRCSG